MDFVVIVVIVALVVAALLGAFALIRWRQRSGSVLAAPDSVRDGGDQP
jgi:sensor c-di-GMP phosphodiesterase-like protein